MHLKDEQNYMINLRLMKVTGLHTLLNPDTPKLFGYNWGKLNGVLFIFIMILVIVGSNMSIYYIMNDFTKTLPYIVIIVSATFVLLKIYFLIRYSKELWEFVNFTSIHFLSYTGHQKTILSKARKLILRISNMFTCFTIFIILVWIVSPIFMKDNYIVVKSTNDTYNHYHYNILSIIFPVTEQYYNNNFIHFYLLESLGLIVYGYSMMNFDYLIISICLTITYQLKMISKSYSKLGFNHIQGNIKGEDRSLIEINKLLLIIQDHQKCIKTIHNVYDIFRPILLFQLIAESLLITIQPFMFILNIDNGMSLASIECIKIILSPLYNLFHLSYMCYLFCIINESKDSTNNALYSCNWTEMNIKFKKLILLTMHMNDSEHLKLKISTKLIINLELLSTIINFTYSIISVLVKQYHNNY